MGDNDERDGERNIFKGGLGIKGIGGIGGGD